MKSFTSFITNLRVNTEEVLWREQDFDPKWGDPDWILTARPTVCALLSHPTPAMLGYA